MIHEIIKFITHYVPLTDEEIQIIEDLKLIATYKKNTILLSEGEWAKECYFVLKGCVRSYYLIDGVEKTTEFYTEQQGIVPTAYVTKRPSEYYLACIEDCVLSLGTKNDLLIEKIPKLKTLILQMNSEMLVEKQLTFDHFKNSSPEVRYKRLMETRSELFGRVPLNQLASFLGITPESLSRIRRRVLKGERRT
jgi:CRP-like cAMP-binding protein